MKYWAYVNNEILGPYEKEEVKALPAYSPTLLICPQTPVGEKTEEWREVSSCPEFSDSMATNSPLMSEQIPDQIETGSLQIDHNFSMSNSGRLNSSRVGSLQPLEQSNSNSGIDIPVNKLARSGRMKASDINWNPENEQQSFQQQSEQPQTDPAPSLEMPQDQNQFSMPEQEQDPFMPPADNNEQPASADPFGDIYKDIGGVSNTPAEQPAAAPAEQQPIQGFEAMPDMQANTANDTPSFGEMPMQNTQEFSLGDNSSSFGQPEIGTPEHSFSFDEQNSSSFNQGNEQSAMPQHQAASGNNIGMPGVGSEQIDNLSHKLDMISQNAITKEDFTMAVDPIKMKLDQFDDMFSSIRNSQNQQQSDLMSKLSNLENSLANIASNIASGASQPSSFQMPPSSGNYESVSLTPSDSMRGYTPSSSTTASLVPADPAESLQKEEKSKKTKKKEEIKDTGAKAKNGNVIVRFFGGIIKLIITLVLLIVLAAAAVAGLKHFAVYDASPIIIDLIKQYLPQYTNIEVPYLLEKSDWNKSNQEKKDNKNSNEAEPQPTDSQPENNTETDDMYKNNETEPEPEPEPEPETVSIPDSKKAEIQSKVSSFKKIEHGKDLMEKLKETLNGMQEEWEIMPGQQEGEYNVKIRFVGPDRTEERNFIYNENDSSLSGKTASEQAILNALNTETTRFNSGQPSNNKKKTGRRGGKKGKAAKKAPEADGTFDVSLDDD